MNRHGALAVLLLLPVLAALPAITRAADATRPYPTVCHDCETPIGIGGTYDFFNRTRGVVVPVTFVWSRNRYEFGVFRMATPQWAESVSKPPAHVVAHPYWGASLSRRWQLYGSPSVRVFLGFGFSYKTETDQLNATHWNFAEQLGVRVRIPGVGNSLELCFRHWSNAGIKLPNKGQDFVTLMYVF